MPLGAVQHCLDVSRLPICCLALVLTETMDGAVTLGTMISSSGAQYGTRPEARIGHAASTASVAGSGTDTTTDNGSA